jgi:hypothetical protein
MKASTVRDIVNKGHAGSLNSAPKEEEETSKINERIR